MVFTRQWFTTNMFTKRYKCNAIFVDLHRVKKISTDFEAEATCKFQRGNYPLRFIDNITNDFIISTNDL